MPVNETLWSKLPKGDQEKAKKAMALATGAENGKPRTQRQSGFQLKGYLRCELSSADKEAFKAWEGAQDELSTMGLLVRSVDSGYLLKVGESGQGYQGSLCAATTGHDWEGYVLTAHAASATRAVALLVYKHLILMHEDWSAWMEDGGEDFMR